MQKKKNNQGIATVGMCVISFGIIFASISTQKWKAGTPVDISKMNAKAYQVSEVSVKQDGSYVVQGTAKGFGSDIKTAVTFDKTGENILSLTIVSQTETAGVGSKITEKEFLNQFNKIAVPIKVADLQVVSPNVESTGESGETAEKLDENYSSAEWNAEDTSAEANTIRSLYEAGLLTSSMNGKELNTAYADLSPEEKAKINLEKANLLTSTDEKEAGETVDATTVDAISGATISSKATVTTINNAYFFLKECVLK